MKKTNFFLVAIVIIGFLLRVWRLSDVPPSLNWDEVSHGFNAYSILKTGADEWGKTFPIANFRAYGDYPLPLNLYLTIPFIKILGLSAFSIRLPHAILGTLTIVAAYFLSWGITKKRGLALLTSLFVALDPWFFFPSRFVLQSNLSVFLLTAGAALFVSGIASCRKYLLFFSFFAFGLTLFAYHTTRIFTPLFLLGLFTIYKSELARFLKENRVWSAASMLVLLVFFVPVPFILRSPEARARANWVFILDQGAVNKIISSRQQSRLPPQMSRFVYNRPVYFVEKFAQNYVEYFSPQFLFLKGGTQYQFSVPGWGLLYAVNLPFFYLGLFVFLKRALAREKNYQLALLWLILAPIPASITNESYTVLRATAMLPIPEVLSAIGLLWAGQFIGKKWRLIAIVSYSIILFGFVEKYLFNYFYIYRANYSWAWQYGYQAAVDYARAHYGEYDRIVITKKYGEPHEFLLFFWPWDPAKYKSDPNLVRFAQSDWFWVDRFDKFYFVNDWQIPQGNVSEMKTEKGINVPLVSKTLLITSPGNYPKVGWSKIKTIHFLDGAPAFDLVEKI